MKTQPSVLMCTPAMAFQAADGIPDRPGQQAQQNDEGDDARRPESAGVFLIGRFRPP